MVRYLIDANLPYRFSLWHGDPYLHVFDLGDDLQPRVEELSASSRLVIVRPTLIECVS